MSIVTGPDSAQERDRQFERIVQQYQGTLLRMCYLYLKDRTLAEDAVQESLIKIYRGLDGFRGDGGEKKWIMKIVIHTCYDMNRSGWLRLMDRRYTPEMLPEAAAPFEPFEEDLVTAMMNLPVKLKEVMLLYYYQGMNTLEIAQALGIFQSSVSGRLKRGRNKLRKALEGREPHA